jgi:hypothetical protein
MLGFLWIVCHGSAHGFYSRKPNFIGVPEITSSQQLRQFRNIRRNPPRLVFREQLGG